MKSTSCCILALSLFFMGIATNAHAEFTADEFYDISEQAQDPQPSPKRKEACNGGSSGQLSCPTSGGPTCNENQQCVCRVISISGPPNSRDESVAVNQCV